MASDTERDDEQPETFGSPTEYATAAEAPQWVQTAVKAFACLPAALSMVSVVLIALFLLALCVIVTLVLLF
jgi:hypothetical protein